MDKEKYSETNNEIGKFCTINKPCNDFQSKSKTFSESMIGDTNLFFSGEEDTMVAEAEIMIAEPWARGKKCGWMAMLLMLLYGITYLNVKQYVVKIALDNEISIKMFSNMGFVQTSVSAVFEEITMNKLVDDAWISWLRTCTEPFSVTGNDCDDN